MNKKTYAPSEPYEFCFSDKLTALKDIEGLTLLDTDRKLRAEGKRQNHCIGGKDYILLCKQGDQAVNYKGYTFHLNNSCEILSTTGPHNCETPMKIENELLQLLA